MDKKTTTDSTQTSTPNVPQWAQDSLFNLDRKSTAIGDADPQSFVAGPSALQTQAYGAGANLGGEASTFGSAADAAKAGGTSLLGDIGSYQSPYVNDVVNTTLGNFDKTAGQQAAQLEAAGARNAAFGGSRFGVAQAEQGAQSNLNRAQTEAQLRDQAFNTAAGLDNADKARMLSSGSLLEGIGNSQGSNARENATAQDALGQDQRSIAQSKATAPISLAQAYAALLGQNQFGLMTGETGTGHSTQTVSDPMGTLSALLNGAGSSASGGASLAKLFIK